VIKVENRLEFHTTIPLSENPPGKIFFSPDRTSSLAPLKLLGKRGEHLVPILLGIEGVLHVMISRYSVDIVKGPAFLWREIKPQVIKILKSCFDDPGHVEVKRKRAREKRKSIIILP